jgi:hypothetical protein
MGWVVRLVEGGVLPPEKRADGTYLLTPSDEPLNMAKVQKSILINYLTGRPNTMGTTTVPPAMKAVTVKVIIFSNRAWKGGGEGMAKAISDWAGINNAQYNANWGAFYWNNNDRWELRQGARAPVVILNRRGHVGHRRSGLWVGGSVGRVTHWAHSAKR